MQEQLPKETPGSATPSRRFAGTPPHARGREISQPLIKEFVWFAERVPTRRFSRNLRDMLLEFAAYKDSVSAPYREDLFMDLGGMFALLDALENEAGQIQQENETEVSDRLAVAFTWFIEHIPARRLGRNLRDMVMEFATYEESATARYWEDLFTDLGGLFRLLDAVEDEAGEVQARI